MADHDAETLTTRLVALLARPGANLVVLRAFLGVTFCFAGLQKLANQNFFRRNGPGSFYAQTSGAIATSPLHHLLSVATHAPVFFAVLISAGELAVGLGTLAGLFSRLAALGGMLLSLTFFLTVSFNDSPYYYGPDIVFLFAWTPIALGGAGAFSLDALLARRAAAIAARTRPSRAAQAALDRRLFLEKSAAVAALAGGGLVLGVLDAVLGRHFAPPAASGGTSATLPTGSGGPATTTTAGSGPTTTTTPAPGAVKGTLIGPASDVPVGGAATFTDPAQQVPAFVIQPNAGHYLAFSAVCTHAGCTVSFDQASNEFVCPCHGSVFNAVTGAVISGPAPSPLPSIPIALGPNGQLYVDG